MVSVSTCNKPLWYFEVCIDSNLVVKLTLTLPWSSRGCIHPAGTCHGGFERMSKENRIESYMLPLMTRVCSTLC